MPRKIATLTMCVVLLQLLAGAAAPAGSSAALAADVHLQGAGATFPNPLYKRWVAEYQKLNPTILIDYQSIGSGGGIKGITDKTIDFAGSDAPMSKKELTAAGGAELLIEIPACAGSIVPAYNVPGIKGDLKFTGEVLADIFSGKIGKWNDPRLVTLNPDGNLPNLPITPAWRTDGSGTTFVWTNYLATQSDDFKSSIGMGKQVKWPAGQGGKGNEGVTAIITGTAGAIGYVEQNYADKNNVTYGLVMNKNGKYVKATPKAVSLAGASAATDMKGNLLAANIWNQLGDESYPISSFTYLIVYKDLGNVKTKEQAQALVNYLWWAIHGGQQFSEELDYAPLAPAVVKKAEEALKTLTYQGKPIELTK